MSPVDRPVPVVRPGADGIRQLPEASTVAVLLDQATGFVQGLAVAEQTVEAIDDLDPPTW